MDFFKSVDYRHTKHVMDFLMNAAKTILLKYRQIMQPGWSISIESATEPDDLGSILAWSSGFHRVIYYKTFSFVKEVRGFMIEQIYVKKYRNYC